MTGFMVRAELGKVLAKRSNRVVLAVLGVLVLVASWLAVTSVRYVDASGAVRTDWQAGRQLIADRQAHAGEITPAVVQGIVAQQRAVRAANNQRVSDAVYSAEVQSAEEIVYAVSHMLQGDTAAYEPLAAVWAGDAAAAGVYERYREHLQAVVTEYGTTPAQQAYLARRYEQIVLPMSYAPIVGWQTMVYYATMLALVLVIGIGFVCAGVLADERQPNTGAVYFTTMHSRGRSIAVKLGVGLGCATAIYWIGMGVLTAVCLAAFGLTGADVPYQWDQPFSIYAVSMGEMYLVVVGFGYLAALVAASVVMSTTAMTTQRMFAVALPFLLFFVSPFIGRALPFKTLFSLTPDQLLNIINNTKIPNFYQLGDTVFSQLTALSVIHGMGVVALVVLAFRRFRACGLVSA